MDTFYNKDQQTLGSASSPSFRQLRKCLFCDWRGVNIHISSCTLPLLSIIFLSTVYDLLTSPDCLPDLLQGGLVGQGVNEAFILASFKLQPRTGTSVFGLYNPRDNSKYFEFTVMGKLNRGRQT